MHTDAHPALSIGLVSRDARCGLQAVAKPKNPSWHKPLRKRRVRRRPQGRFERPGELATTQGLPPAMATTFVPDFQPLTKELLLGNTQQSTKGSYYNIYVSPPYARSPTQSPPNAPHPCQPKNDSGNTIPPNSGWLPTLSSCLQTVLTTPFWSRAPRCDTLPQSDVVGFDDSLSQGSSVGVSVPSLLQQNMVSLSSPPLSPHPPSRTRVRH